MGTFIKLLLAVCTLLLTANFIPIVNTYRSPWTPSDYSMAGSRRARAVNRPAPINCQLQAWSSWTSCDSCTDQKGRFRRMEKPSQFGGTECVESLWEKLACPSAATECLVTDYCGERFTCKETGRCISQSLRCNGESDCNDFSDEDGCEVVNRRGDKCSTLLPIPSAERGTQGYNVLTGDFVDRVLDSNYFGGKCEYVYNGEWRKFIYEAVCENLRYNEDEKNYRKPHNYHTYQFVAEATSEGSQDYFTDAVSLLNARKTMSSANGGVTLGIYKVEVGLSGSSESEFFNNVTQYNSQELGFVRLFSKVQTAHFKMRSNKLMLDEEFYVSLMELPEQYHFGTYSRFFNTFGTHYVTEGTMGGTLEYVVVLNKTAMAESNTEAEQAGVCLGASIGLSQNLSTNVNVDLKVKGNVCRKERSTHRTNDSDSAEIVDIVSLVKGGVTHSSAGLLAIRNPDTYRSWGASLRYNPTLIEYETMPIYELVRLSTAADHVGARLANLERGWDEYQRQFDSCRCAPCRHNGIPVLTGTSCRCVCKPGFQGKACEETLRKDAPTDGSWSCWGAWSSCSSGKKTRTRTCDNPAPDGGGTTCLGSSSQAQRC
uniref:Complement C8 alpha chain n=1 Tax=Gasterosteus aculeatus aculeatus TaxID=481459 RepID=A0AAQ4PXP0_GASAC|nr:complement component C8 alpha chain [Gasterosteus aculeatus aculeatus]